MQYGPAWRKLWCLHIYTHQHMKKKIFIYLPRKFSCLAHCWAMFSVTYFQNLFNKYQNGLTFMTRWIKFLFSDGRTDWLVIGWLVIKRNVLNIQHVTVKIKWRNICKMYAIKSPGCHLYNQMYLLRRRNQIT